MLSEVAEFVIQGITVEGEIFQPPDWVERLCDMLSNAAADGSKACPEYVRPIMINGVHSVVVQVLLQKANPHAFGLVKQFIAENRLVVRSGRGSRDAETTGPLTVFERERRDRNRNNG